MCYTDKDRPPVPASTNGTAEGQDLVLTAADGNRFMAYLAEPSNPTGTQIVIYPDVRGLHGFYRDLAERFAECGVRALALDYFGRTGGVGARDESFDFGPHVQQIVRDAFYQDARAALDYLQRGDGDGKPTYVVGFCMGGSLALLSATQELGLAGVIAFYAGMSREFGGKGTALDHAHEAKYPVLGLFGGADQGIPAEQVHKLDTELDRAGVEHEIVIYPGAPHSFFDRKAAEYASESADAWERVLRFVKREE